jgi:ribosome assembly protein YihI (activator of Der GTPase)
MPPVKRLSAAVPGEGCHRGAADGSSTSCARTDGSVAQPSGQQQHSPRLGERNAIPARCTSSTKRLGPHRPIRPADECGLRRKHAGPAYG